MLLTLFADTDDGHYTVHVVNTEGKQTELLKLPYEEDDFLTCVDNQVRTSKIGFQTTEVWSYLWLFGQFKKELKNCSSNKKPFTCNFVLKFQIVNEFNIL